VVGGGGADSVLRFQLKRGDDRTKSCWKMKQRQRARLGSIGMKHDTTQQRDDVSRRRGGTEKGKGKI
jgi:hypothetical protein